MKYAGLFVLILGRLVMGAPRALLKATTGFGYADTFTIGDKTIVRPASFKSKAHKRAFEDVGRYLTDALTRDVMLSYQEKSLVQDTFFGRHKVPLEIWREVLKHFADEGCITARWELGIPSYGEYLRTPSWGPDGARLPEAKDNWVGGLVPDSVEFIPSLLTEAQMRELLGKPYALHPTDCLKRDETQTYVTLEPRHFALTYFRRREDLLKEDLERGAKTMTNVLKFASKD